MYGGTTVLGVCCWCFDPHAISLMFELGQCSYSPVPDVSICSESNFQPANVAFCTIHFQAYTATVDFCTHGRRLEDLHNRDASPCQSLDVFRSSSPSTKSIGSFSCSIAVHHLYQKCLLIHYPSHLRHPRHITAFCLRHIAITTSSAHVVASKHLLWNRFLLSILN